MNKVGQTLETIGILVMLVVLLWLATHTYMDMKEDHEDRSQKLDVWFEFRKRHV